MPPAVFEPSVTASERAQIHALDRAGTGIGYSLELIADKMRSNFVSALRSDLLTAVLLRILFSRDAVLRVPTSRKLSHWHRLQGQAASEHACARTNSHQHTTVLFWTWTSIYDSCYRHGPQLPNLWHAVRFPWHAAFTAVPVFVFARPASLYCKEYVYILHIADCIYNV